MPTFFSSESARAARRRAEISRRLRRFAPPFFASAATLALCVGCGTTKFSDTGRTATEQLLISSAMEQVVDEYDYSRLAGLKVFLKIANSATDADYLKSLLRQQLAANGVFIKDSQDDADYILEVAPGTVGTNRYEMMYGIPETSIPSIGTIEATSIPEFALIKRTDQKAQVKLLMWAYNKQTGAIVWQSGVKTKTSNIRDRWIFGAGPFTNASFEGGKTRLGGDAVPTPTITGEKISQSEKPSVLTEAVYNEIDEKALQRLAKIREEGLADALAAEETLADDSEGLEIDDGKENATEKDAKNEETAQNAQTTENKETAQNAQAAENKETAQNNATTPTPPIGAIPTPTSAPLPPPTKNDDDFRLDFGDDAVLELRSVYVPDGRKR